MLARRILTSALVALLLVIGAGRAVVPVRAALGPATRTWPSLACQSTLQNCIAGANNLDTVLIDTNAAVGEQLSIVDKTLTLRAAAGRHPYVAGALAITANTGTIHVRVAGITFAGQVSAHLFGGSGHRITLDHVNIHQTIFTGAFSSSAMDFQTVVPASFTYTGGDITDTLDQGTGMTMDASNASGAVALRVVGVRVNLAKAPTSGDGIEVYARGAGGTVTADIDNNTVWHAATCGCGASTGIELLGGRTAKARLNLVGNTVDRIGKAGANNATGIDVRNSLEAGGQMAVYAYNNVISRVSGFGLLVGPSSSGTLAFHAGYNDMFANTQGNLLSGHSLGSHNLAVSPGYAQESTGNLRLRASSPLIDKGQVCSPGGIANLDARGNGRLHGASVDMGAYERGAGIPTGIAEVGTSAAEELDGTTGDDILCGYGGKDILDGGRGNDYLDGGAGNDSITGGPGSDRLFGGTGADDLCAKDGKHGNDYVDGGAGRDNYSADSGDVRTRVEHKIICLR